MKTREPIIDVYMVFHRCSISFLQTVRDILNSLICVVRFSNNVNSVFHKKRFMKRIGAVAYSMPRKKNRLDT